MAEKSATMPLFGNSDTFDILPSKKRYLNRAGFFATPTLKLYSKCIYIYIYIHVKKGEDERRLTTFVHLQLCVSVRYTMTYGKNFVGLRWKS